MADILCSDIIAIAGLSRNEHVCARQSITEQGD